MKSTIQAGPRLLRDSTIKEEPPYSCEDIDPRHRFLRQMQDAFDRASVEAGGTIDRNLQIADLPVCLRFAGPKLISPLMRALGSAAEFNGHIQPFKIHVWDTQSTGVILPAPPWKLDDFAEQGKIRGFFGGSTFILFQWASYSLSVLDTERRTGFFWMKDASDIPYFEKAAPFRVLFHLYMRARNIQFLHSAAIGMKEGGALVVGKAGAGKSTTMLASLRSDLLCAADDYCLVSGDAPVFGSQYI